MKVNILFLCIQAAGTHARLAGDDSNPLKTLKDFFGRSDNAADLLSLFKQQKSTDNDFERMTASRTLEQDVTLTSGDGDDTAFCSLNSHLETIGDIIEGLVPDEMFLNTYAEELVYMTPCNGLPLTRQEFGGPKFGYVAAYSYITDVIVAVIQAAIFLVDIFRCMGDPNAEANDLSNAVDEVKEFFEQAMQFGMNEEDPLNDYLGVEWVGTPCADHLNGNTSVACSSNMPCCSYDISGGSAEFHPVCGSDGLCVVENITETCVKEGQPCIASGQCCQKENSDVICQFTDIDYETGTCTEEPAYPIGWNPFCLAYSEKSFAFNFKFPFPPLYIDPRKALGSLFPSTKGGKISKKLGFPPKGDPNQCYMVNGFTGRVPTGHTTITVQFEGMGVGWGQDLGYGMNDATYGGEYGNSVPQIWDGFLSQDMPPNPGTNFWLGTRVNIIPTPKQEYDVLKCKLYNKGLNTFWVADLEKKFKLVIQMDFELYVDGGESECIVIAMKDAMVKVGPIKLVFARGIGGWCTNAKKNDVCSPQGFFFNVEPTFDIYTMGGVSILDTFLYGIPAVSDVSEEEVNEFTDKFDLSGGISFGVFIDDDGDPTAVVARIELPTLSIFGIQVTPSAGFHFQWFKGSEFNRRIDRLLRFDGSPVCGTTTDTCETWKPYVRWVYDGNSDQYYDAYANDNVEICEDKLFELDHYNRIMTATTSDGWKGLPQRLDEKDAKKVNTWYSNPKFDQYVYPDSDNIVLYLEITSWYSPIVQLYEISFTFIMQIEDEIDFDFEFSENATEAELDNFVTELQNVDSNNDEVDVYAEIYTEVSVVFIVNFKAAASIQNNIDGKGTYDEWVVAAMFEVDLGVAGVVTVNIESDPFKWSNLRRELKDGNVTEDEYHRMTRELSAVEPKWTVDLEYGDIPILDALKDIANVLYNTFIAKPIKFLSNLAQEIGEILTENFEDSLFDPDTWDELKDLARDLMDDRHENTENLIAELGEGDYVGALDAGVELVTDELQNQAKILEHLGEAVLETFDGAVDTLGDIWDEYQKAFTDAEIWLTCNADPCFHNGRHDFYNFQGSVSDEYGCPQERWQVRAGCRAKSGGLCSGKGDKRWDSTRKYFTKCTGSCQLCRRQKLEEEERIEMAKEAKMQDVQNRLNDLKDFKDAYLDSKTSDSKGLYAVHDDTSILGTSQTVTFQKVRVATSGHEMSNVQIKAEVKNLPHLRKSNDSPSFYDEILFEGDELYNIDFSLKDGEDTNTASNRIFDDIMSLAKTKITDKFVGNTNLKNSKLSKYAPDSNMGQRYYSVCGSSGPSCGGKYEVLDPSEIRGIRCCKEADSKPDKVEFAGYEWNRGVDWQTKCSADDVYGETAETDGQCAKGSFWTAKKTCEDIEARLCSKEELENDCAQGTGCGLDVQMVWSGTVEKVVQMDTSFYATCGSSSAGCAGEYEILDSSEKRTARCCKEADSKPTTVELNGNFWLKGKEWSGQCAADGIYGESVEKWDCSSRRLFGDTVDGINDFIKCQENGEMKCVSTDYWSAKKTCEKIGARLCSKEELASDCTKGTGCGDNVMVWSGSHISLEGQYCHSHDMCLSKKCDFPTNKCVALANGEECTADAACKSNVCNELIYPPRCTLTRDTMYSTQCGSSAAGCADQFELLDDPSEERAVRCCKEAESKPGFVRSNGRKWEKGYEWSKVCAADGIYGETAEYLDCLMTSSVLDITNGVELGGGNHCQLNGSMKCLYANYKKAKKTCEDIGARLCTREELASDCTQGSGCGDDVMVWSGSFVSLVGQFCYSDDMCLYGPCNLAKTTCIGLPEHEECSADDQCKSKICNTLLEPPICDNRAPGSLDANCQKDNDCSNDLHCHRQLDVCKRPGSIDEVCEDDSHCQAFLYCQIGRGQKLGKCARR